MRRKCAMPVVVGLSVLGFSEGCASSAVQPTPIPTLASSPQSLSAFDAIRDAWKDPSTSTPAVLRARIDGFLERYPNDGLAPLAHVLLALVALRQVDLAAADRELLGPSPPAGTTRDLWTVARATRARMLGDPDRALDLLRPLVGKSVDPIGGAVFEEELTRATLATHRDFEAISYMDAWLRASGGEDRETVVRKVRALVADLPTAVLRAALDAMRSRRASYGYGPDIERILTDRLVAVATSSADSDLARTLLDADAGTLPLSRDAAAALGELAAARRGLAVVEGRTVGLLLPAESAPLRDESSDVLLGVMWALGLPEGVRSAAMPSKAASDAGPVAPGSVRPPSEPRGRGEGPSRSEHLRLVTRGDAGGTEATEVSLGELAGEGASIIVAGVDGATSARALRWANATGVVVVVIVPPENEGEAGPFGFVVGARRRAVVLALAGGIGSLSQGTVVPVVDESDLTEFPADGTSRYGLDFGSPVSCDATATRAGDPRFPVAEWARQHVASWIASGSSECARDLVADLSRSGETGTVALSLEASGLPSHAQALHVFTAAAGHMPPGETPPDDEMREFLKRFGRLSWLSALARDAATLARAALLRLPTDTVTGPRATAERRARARDLFAEARASLWTTERDSWAADHEMPRTLRVAEVESAVQTKARSLVEVE
ncbi:MAG: hypothetical protein ABTD50_08825 [Polyangiaceae bacterium]